MWTPFWFWGLSRLSRPVTWISGASARWCLITKVRHNQETNLVAKQCEIVVTRVVICVQIADNFTWLHLRINQTHETSDNSLLLSFFKWGKLSIRHTVRTQAMTHLCFTLKNFPQNTKAHKACFAFLFSFLLWFAWPLHCNEIRRIFDASQVAQSCLLKASTSKATTTRLNISLKRGDSNLEYETNQWRINKLFYSLGVSCFDLFSYWLRHNSNISSFLMGGT